MQLKTIDLTNCDINSLPPNSFLDLSAGDIDLTGNALSAVGTGAFNNVKLDSLKILLYAGEVDYGEIMKNSNISNIYMKLPYDFNQYYNTETARCFRKAPIICAANVYIPLCVDVMESLDCKDQVSEIHLDLSVDGPSCSGDSCRNLSYPVVIKSPVQFGKVFLSTGHVHDAVYTCFDASRMLTDTFYFIQDQSREFRPLCTQSLLSVSNITKNLVLDFKDYQIALPETLLQFSNQLVNLVVTGNVTCDCWLANNFYTFVNRVRVNATCRDGLDVTEFVLSNYANCSNQLSLTTSTPDINSVSIMVDCGDWCKIDPQLPITSTPGSLKQTTVSEKVTVPPSQPVGTGSTAVSPNQTTASEKATTSASQPVGTGSTTVSAKQTTVSDRNTTSTSHYSKSHNAKPLMSTILGLGIILVVLSSGL